MNDAYFQKIKNKKIKANYLIISNKKEICFEWFNNLKKTFSVNSADAVVINTQNQIKIKDIRQVQKDIKLKPHSSEYKLVYIYNADNLGLEASNALLKTLEEPPGNSIIVLAATNLEKILPTVISRCQIIRLKSQIKEVDLDNELEEIKKMKIYEKFEYAKKISQNQNINDWFEKLITSLRKKLDIKKNRLVLKQIIKYQGIIQNTNANKQLVLENLMLDIKEL